MIGWYTLFKKEILRFWKVSFQTVLAPVVTALLYLMIFTQVLNGKVEPYPGVSYAAFLVPAFANSSSSLIQSKITGNLIFVLLPPLSHFDFFSAYVAAAMVRGVVVGFGVLVATIWFVGLTVEHPVWLLIFTLIGSSLLGVMGVIAGIWAEKFDQLAAFQNFVIVPATFLSGVFYSIHSLPPVWQAISHANPFFYLIDGFRYGFFGVGDMSPYVSLGVAMFSLIILTGFAMRLIVTGYKLRG